MLREIDFLTRSKLVASVETAGETLPPCRGMPHSRERNTLQSFQNERCDRSDAVVVTGGGTKCRDVPPNEIGLFLPFRPRFVLISSSAMWSFLRWMGCDDPDTRSAFICPKAAIVGSFGCRQEEICCKTLANKTPTWRWHFCSSSTPPLFLPLSVLAHLGFSTFISLISPSHWLQSALLTTRPLMPLL